MNMLATLAPAASEKPVPQLVAELRDMRRRIETLYRAAMIAQLRHDDAREMALGDEMAALEEEAQQHAAMIRASIDHALEPLGLTLETAGKLML